MEIKSFLGKMKKTYYLLLLPIVFIACQKEQNMLPEAKPIYSDHKNIWEQRNLFGKVKQIEWYKSKNDEGKVLKNLTEKYTDFGKLLEISSYDENEELIQKDSYEFDENQEMTYIKSKNIIDGSLNYVLSVEYDSFENTETKNIEWQNGFYQTKSFFDSNDNLLKQRIIDQDTSFIDFKYQYNDQGKITVEEQFAENRLISKIKNSYDENNRLIRTAKRINQQESITEWQWKNDRIVEELIYSARRNSEPRLEETTEFDRLYNPILKTFYGGSNPLWELKYDYEYDEKANWTLREIWIKEIHKGSENFKLAYIEKRKIEYWE